MDLSCIISNSDPKISINRRNGECAMSAEVYYFTGTGNSLAAAREIAANIKGTLISIPSVITWKTVT